MKRIFLCIVVIGLLCHTVIAQEAVNLDTALKNTVEYFVGRLTAGSRVIVLNIASRYPDLSDYIINELTMHLYNNGSVMMVDRQNLDAIRQELDFQYSGEVSDESMVSIGRMLGAQTILSGNIVPLGNTYRLQIRAIAVETAAIQGFQSINIVIDRMIATLTGTPITQAMLDEERRLQREERIAEAWKLDGKNVFAFSLNGTYIPVNGFSGGLNITLFEKHYSKLAPSVFLNFNMGIATVKISDFRNVNTSMDKDEVERWDLYMAFGGGVLLKYRVTDKFILNVGPSLEGLFMHNYGWSLGLGVQGGLSYRVHPNITLDLNGIVKIGFGDPWEVKVDDYRGVYSYTAARPLIGGVQMGINFMFPYGGKRNN